MSYKILVCQNKTCKQQGSNEVLRGFQRYRQRYNLPDDWAIASGCLGQCGSGPTVLVVPEDDAVSIVEEDTENSAGGGTERDIQEDTQKEKKIWHKGVQPQDAWRLAEQYSGMSAPSRQKIDGVKPASATSSIGLWIGLVSLGAFFIICIAVAIFAAQHSHYV